MGKPDVGRREVLQWAGCALLLAACDDPDAETSAVQVPAGQSRFRRIYADPQLRERFLLFLTNVFHLMPERALHRAIAEACQGTDDDHAIYERLRERVPSLSPTLASVRYALPALAKQKQVMAEQTKQLVGERDATRYVEIGTPGRYVDTLRSQLRIGQEVYLVHTQKPSYSPEDIVERGQLSQAGQYVPLKDYAPLTDSSIPRGKIDLLTNYIGLHHAPRERLPAFVESIREILKPGGVFVLRDHDHNC